MEHDQLFKAMAGDLAADPDIAALFLGGSFGKGTADAFSDIDLVAIAEAEHHRRILDLWRTAFARRHAVIYWNEIIGRGALVNAITDGWLRCDLYLTPRAGFVDRSRATVRPLFDRAGIYDDLPDALPAAQPKAETVLRISREFIRVLGLMPVGMGRGEYVTLVKGVGLLRDMLADLMLEECPLPDRGGALHQSRLLTPDQMSVLMRLPFPGPEREAVMAAHIAIADAFFPLAKRLAAQTGVVWPHEFEAATRQHLQTTLGVQFH